MERLPEEQRKIEQLRSAIKGPCASLLLASSTKTQLGARSLLLILGLFVAIADVTLVGQTPRLK